MGDVRKALKMRRDAQRRWALAPEYDLVRRDFDLGLADEMDREAQNGHSMKSSTFFGTHK